MARPRLFDEAEVKTALRDVFWEHGYEGASYADIMAATGLQKGSLYASFGNKEKLYHLALANYNANMVTPGVAMLRNESMSGYERITMLFDSLIDAAETVQGRWGCLLCNAATDRAPIDPATQEVVQESMSRLREAIRDCVLNTQAWDKAELIWTAYFGARVHIKAGYTKADMEKTKTQILELFE